MNPKNIRLHESTITLANTTELAVRVISDIAGNEISNTISGDSLTSDALRAMIISRIAHNASKMSKRASK